MSFGLGDPAALFERHGAAIFRRCLAILADTQAAEDTTQEVFMRALTHRERFRGDSTPFTWLYRVATTACLQQLRNSQRRAEKLRGIQAAARAEIEPDPSQRLDLERVLAEEDEQTLAIAYLRFVDELTMEEVAEIVGLSRKTVQKRIEALRRRSLAKAEGGAA